MKISLYLIRDRYLIQYHIKLCRLKSKIILFYAISQKKFTEIKEHMKEIFNNK